MLFPLKLIFFWVISSPIFCAKAKWTVRYHSVIWAGFCSLKDRTPPDSGGLNNGMPLMVEVKSMPGIKPDSNGTLEPQPLPEKTRSEARMTMWASPGSVDRDHMGLDATL